MRSPATPAAAALRRAAATAHVADLKLEGFYRQLGQAFSRFSGWGAVVLSGNPLFTRAVPRKPEISHRLFNGPLEVRLLRFDL